VAEAWGEEDRHPAVSAVADELQQVARTAAFAVRGSSLGEDLPEEPRTTKAVVRATFFFQALH
jgi:hypothetical protein